MLLHNYKACSRFDSILKDYINFNCQQHMTGLKIIFCWLSMFSDNTWELLWKTNSRKRNNRFWLIDIGPSKIYEIGEKFSIHGNDRKLILFWYKNLGVFVNTFLTSSSVMYSNGLNETLSPRFCSCWIHMAESSRFSVSLCFSRRLSDCVGRDCCPLFFGTILYII